MEITIGEPCVCFKWNGRHEIYYYLGKGVLGYHDGDQGHVPSAYLPYNWFDKDRTIFQFVVPLTAYRKIFRLRPATPFKTQSGDYIYVTDLKPSECVPSLITDVLPDKEHAWYTPDFVRKRDEVKAFYKKAMQDGKYLATGNLEVTNWAFDDSPERLTIKYLVKY